MNHALKSHLQSSCLEDCDCSIDAIILELKFSVQCIVLVQGNIVCTEVFEIGDSLISTKA